MAKLSSDDSAILRPMCGDPRVVDDLERLGQVRRIGAGALFIEDSADDDDVFFILSGQARAFLVSIEGREMWLSHFDAGEIIGEMSALTGRPRSASVVAATDMRVLVISAAGLRDVLDRHGRFARNIAERVAARLYTTTQQMFAAAISPMDRRLQDMLLKKSTSQGENMPQRVIAPVPVLSELALELGTTRETLSRTLNKLIRLGQIVRRPDHLLLLGDLD